MWNSLSPTKENPAILGVNVNGAARTCPYAANIRPPRLECPLCHKQTYLKDATCPVTSELHEGDVVCHCQQARICIRTRRSCIGRVASEARHYQDTRSHAACVPLRRHHVPERCERDAASPACVHSETLGVSELFASESCASAPSQAAPTISLLPQMRPKPEFTLIVMPNAPCDALFRDHRQQIQLHPEPKTR